MKTTSDVISFGNWGVQSGANAVPSFDSTAARHTTFIAHGGTVAGAALSAALFWGGHAVANTNTLPTRLFPERPKAEADDTSRSSYAQDSATSALLRQRPDLEVFVREAVSRFQVDQRGLGVPEVSELFHPDEGTSLVVFQFNCPSLEDESRDAFEEQIYAVLESLPSYRFVAPSISVLI